MLVEQDPGTLRTEETLAPRISNLNHNGDEWKEGMVRIVCYLNWLQISGFCTCPRMTNRLFFTTATEKS